MNQASATVLPLRTAADRSSSSPAATMPFSSSESREGAAERRAREEAELIARICAGDEGAFEILFRTHAVPLCAFAQQYVKSRDIAVEVVHDVFLKIWERRERLEVRESLQAYIYRAARNRALDLTQRDARERLYVEQALRDQAADEPTAATPTHRLIEQQDLVAAMEQVVAEFPERRRMVFVLRWKSGLRYEEIAELMEISIKTVENQMTRALRELRTRLAPHL